MTEITDSAKAVALSNSADFRKRIMYLIWRHSIFCRVNNLQDAAAKMAAAKTIQADPLKLEVVVTALLTSPEVMGVLSESGGGGEADDTLLLSQVEGKLLFWAGEVI